MKCWSSSLPPQITPPSQESHILHSFCYVCNVCSLSLLNVELSRCTGDFERVMIAGEPTTVAPCTNIFPLTSFLLFLGRCLYITQERREQRRYGISLLTGFLSVWSFSSQITPNFFKGTTRFCFFRATRTSKLFLEPVLRGL